MDALLSRTNPSLGFSRIFAAAAIIAFSGIQGLLHRRILKSDTQPVIDQLKANNEIGQPAIFEMLAHQLKTSLTTIIGFSRILNSNAVSEKMQKNYVEYIFTSSNNLLQTYNNLTYMHKLENDEIFVKSEICSIYQIFEDAYHKSSEKLIGSQSKIKLSLSVSEADRALTLSIDRKKLEMIVNNLLDTVLYFPERGTIVFGYLVEKEDEIKIFFNGSNGKLSLRNFEEAFNNYKHRSKGIDPFFDLSSLRMMVTKGIIELLGGKLWSVPNERTGIAMGWNLLRTGPEYVF